MIGLSTAYDLLHILLQTSGHSALKSYLSIDLKLRPIKYQKVRAAKFPIQSTTMPDVFVENRVTVALWLILQFCNGLQNLPVLILSQCSCHLDGIKILGVDDALSQ